MKTKMMIFEWDENKDRQNFRKHGISFTEAREVFFDVNVLFEDDRTEEGEVRGWAIGRLLDQAVIVVVHVSRDEYGEEIIRIISARKAGPNERERYFRQALGGEATTGR